MWMLSTVWNKNILYILIFFITVTHNNYFLFHSDIKNYTVSHSQYMTIYEFDLLEFYFLAGHRCS